MKKLYLLLICLSAFLIVFSSCKQEKTPNITNSSSTISQITEPSSSKVVNTNCLITQEQALQILKDNLPDRDFIIDYEGIKIDNNKEYYGFHVYTVSTKPLIDDDGNEFSMNFTYSWPYVDCNTGELFEVSHAPAETIKPWENRK